MGEKSSILVSEKNGIQTLTLNRPKKKNAIQYQMYKRLSVLLKESSENDAIIMTVITGTGTFFSSGNDISFPDTTDGDSDPIVESINTYKRFIDSLIMYPKLLVAVINGPAIGIAVTMLPLFDMVYASEKAYFQTPFTSLGLTAEGCSTYTFPRIMGNSKAGDMLYMCYKMSAAEAKQYGLISDIYKDSNIDEIWTHLNKIRTLSREAIVLIKNTMRRWNQKMLLDVNATEAEILISRNNSEDLIERMLAKLSQRGSKI